MFHSWLLPQDTPPPGLRSHVRGPHGLSPASHWSWLLHRLLTEAPPGSTSKTGAHHVSYPDLLLSSLSLLGSHSQLHTRLTKWKGRRCLVQGWDCCILCLWRIRRTQPTFGEGRNEWRNDHLVKFWSLSPRSLWPSPPLDYVVITPVLLPCRTDSKLLKGRPSSFFFLVSPWHAMHTQKGFVEQNLPPFKTRLFLVTPIFQGRHRGPGKFRDLPKLVNYWAMWFNAQIFYPKSSYFFFNLVFPVTSLSSSWTGIYRSFQHYAHAVKSYVWDLGILNLTNVWKKNTRL